MYKFHRRYPPLKSCFIYETQRSRTLTFVLLVALGTVEWTPIANEFTGQWTLVAARSLDDGRTLQLETEQTLLAGTEPTFKTWYLDQEYITPDRPFALTVGRPDRYLITSCLLAANF